MGTVRMRSWLGAGEGGNQEIRQGARLLSTQCVGGTRALPKGDGKKCLPQRDCERNVNFQGNTNDHRMPLMQTGPLRPGQAPTHLYKGYGTDVTAALALSWATPVCCIEGLGSLCHWPMCADLHLWIQH